MLEKLEQIEKLINELGNYYLKVGNNATASEILKYSQIVKLLNDLEKIM